MGTVLRDGSEVIEQETPAEPPAPGAERHRLNGLTIDLIEGSLANPGRAVDAIVSSDDNYLSHSSGVSADLWRAAGRDFIATQTKARPTLTLGEVHVTTAGDLPARFLFHAITIDLDLNRTLIPAHLPIVYRKVFRLARENGCTSIALPLLAAGAAQISPTLSAAALTQALRTSNRGPLREVFLCVVPETYETARSVLSASLSTRRRDSKWWIAGALTWFPREESEELTRQWLATTASDTEWRVSLAQTLESVVEMAHRRLAAAPDTSLAMGAVRGALAEVRMARNHLVHGKGKLSDDDLSAAETALHGLGMALRWTASPGSGQKPGSPWTGQVPCEPANGHSLPVLPPAHPVASAPETPTEVSPAPAEALVAERLQVATAPAPPAQQAARDVASLVLPQRPDAEGGTGHVRALHQLLLAKLRPSHLEALSAILETRGYRGDRDFRLLEHLVRQDPAKLLLQFFSVFDLREILEKDYGLRLPDTLSHRRAAALLLRQLGFQPPRRPRGLLAAQSATREAAARVRLLQDAGSQLRGHVLEVGSWLEYACHILLRFVSQVAYEVPLEVLVRERALLRPDESLEKLGLGGLFRLTGAVDSRIRKNPPPRLQMFGFPQRPLLPEHGIGALPDIRNHFAHGRPNRRLTPEDRLRMGRNFLEGAQGLLDYLASPEERAFPFMVVVRAIHYDRWGRRKVSAEAESGAREILFTDRPLRPGEAYMMRPLSNPVRVDPLLVPAGDFELPEGD